MSNLLNFVSAWPTNIGVPPDGDPKVLIIPGITFTATGLANAQRVDFRGEAQRAIITNIQSLWIDNDTDARVTVEVGAGSKQRIIGKARTQGWYPIAMTDDLDLLIYASAAIADATALRIGVANVNLIVGPYGI